MPFESPKPAPVASGRATPEVGVPTVPRSRIPPPRTSDAALHLDLSELARSPAAPREEAAPAPESTPALTSLGAELDALFDDAFNEPNARTPASGAFAVTPTASLLTPYDPAASAYFVSVAEAQPSSPALPSSLDDDTIDIHFDELDFSASAEPAPAAEVRDAEAELAPLERILEVCVALHTLPRDAIDPRGAYLMSRIDGTITLEELVDLSGMERALVLAWRDAGWVRFA